MLQGFDELRPRSVVFHALTVGLGISEDFTIVLNNGGPGASVRGNFVCQLLERNRAGLAVGTRGKHPNFVLKILLKLGLKRCFPAMTYNGIERDG